MAAKTKRSVAEVVEGERVVEETTSSN